MTKKTSRQIALERRIAMSDGGKKSLANSSTKQDRVRSASDARLSPTIIVKKSSVISKNNNSLKKRHIPQKSSALLQVENLFFKEGRLYQLMVNQQ